MAVRAPRLGMKLPPATAAWSRLRYRARQGAGALRPTLPVDRDEILTAALTAPQRQAFSSLSIHDQAHCCRVYRRLRNEGASSDLLIAGLLHDIGKVGPDGRVRLPDRVARVVLRRLAPGLLTRIARLPARPGRVGIARAVHHPRLGADQARLLGCSERVCWLIAHHEDVPPPDDADLRRLIAADHAAG
jgi:hypothetical protein